MPLFLFFSLILTDVFSNLYPLLGKVGVILWMVMFLQLMVFAIHSFRIIWTKNNSERSWFTIVVLIILTLWLGIQSVQYSNVSGETTQEITCQLHHFLYSDDWGYNQTCLFGYPARQLILPSLPSLLFGRSVPSLHLGVIVYFLISITVFASGIILFFGRRNGDYINAILLTSLPHIYFFNHFMFFFEQSIFPLLFTFLLVGILLHFFSNTKDKETFGYVGLLLLILIYSYTPSLATYTLTILFLICLILIYWKKNDLKKIKTMSIVFIIFSQLSLLLSFRYRGDILLFSNERTFINLLTDVRDGFWYLIYPGSVSFHTFSPSYVTWSYQVVLSIVLIVLIINYRNPFVWVGLLWCIGTIVISVVVRGYSYYSVDFRLHRALVIFPLIMIFQSMVIGQYLIKLRIPKYMVLFGVCVFFISGFFNSHQQLSTRANNIKHVQFVDWLAQNGRSNMQNVDTIFITKNALGVYNFGSLGNIVGYFYPSIQVQVQDKDSIPNRSLIIYHPSREQLTSKLLKGIRVVGYFHGLGIVYYP